MCRVMLHPSEDIIKQRGREAKGVGNFCVQAQKTRKSQAEESPIVSVLHKSICQKLPANVSFYAVNVQFKNKIRQTDAAKCS